VEIFRFEKKVSEPYKKNKNYGSKKSIAGIESLLHEISVEDFQVRPEDVKIIYSGGNVFPYDEREQWTDSCNVVALKEGVVVGYDRNDKTAEAFIQQGFSVITTTELFKQFEAGLHPQSIKDTLILLPSAELSRARGGSHCMSMPLLRQSISSI
jgi:arginine deiminase